MPLHKLCLRRLFASPRIPLQSGPHPFDIPLVRNNLATLPDTPSGPRQVNSLFELCLSLPELPESSIGCPGADAFGAPHPVTAPR